MKLFKELSNKIYEDNLRKLFFAHDENNGEGLILKLQEFYSDLRLSMIRNTNNNLALHGN